MNKIEVLKTCLLNIVDNIDAGNSYIDENQCEEAIEMLNRMMHAENKYSKYQSCKYLGLSRATFDRYIKDGLIPEGRKESGFTEKFWYKRDLDVSRNKILNLRNNSSSSN